MRELSSTERRNSRGIQKKIMTKTIGYTRLKWEALNVSHGKVTLYGENAFLIRRCFINVFAICFTSVFPEPLFNLHRWRERFAVFLI